MAARRWLTALAAALAGIAAFGLASAVDPSLRPRRGSLPAADEAAIRGVLETYNQVYQDFYASEGVAAMIDEFPATRDLKHRLFRDIGFLRDAGFVQVQDLANAEVREVRATGPVEAEALVFEEWNHLLQRSGSRLPVDRPRGLGQGFRYRLRKEGGRWLVVGWDLAELAPPVDDGRFTW